MKKSKIIVEVGLNENQLPVEITWEAPDAEKKNECKSAMLTFWDPKENNTLRIDLWTPEMSVEEMRKFYVQNMLTLTDTYVRATGDDVNGEAIKQIMKDIGLKMNVLR